MSSERVLVVDDTEDFLWIVSEKLDQHFKVRCLTANSVNEAEEILKTQDFDLIITDYHMPHRDGLEIIRILEKQKKVAVVALFTSDPPDCGLLKTIDYPLTIVDKANMPELLEFCAMVLDEQYVRMAY